MAYQGNIFNMNGVRNRLIGPRLGSGPVASLFGAQMVEDRIYDGWCVYSAITSECRKYSYGPTNNIVTRRINRCMVDMRVKLHGRPLTLSQILNDEFWRVPYWPAGPATSDCSYPILPVGKANYPQVWFGSVETYEDSIRLLCEFATDSLRVRSNASQSFRKFTVGVDIARPGGDYQTLLYMTTSQSYSPNRISFEWRTENVTR